MKDIENIGDIEVMVRHHYKLMLGDDQIAHFFKDLDLEEHLNIIFNFWSTILLGTRSYVNNTVGAHSHLKLSKIDLDHWLSHFNTAVDTHFIGPLAEEAKSRAQTIGLTMLYKINGHLK
ncbi:MAG: group III truncated hemoglobin [Chitinophagales bacterium]|jgi:hemoglobin|nr:group III truncated hemoglobin [Chitinophagales bacterium]